MLDACLEARRKRLLGTRLIAEGALFTHKSVHFLAVRQVVGDGAVDALQRSDQRERAEDTLRGSASLVLRDDGGKLNSGSGQIQPAFSLFDVLHHFSLDFKCSAPECRVDVGIETLRFVRWNG